MKHDHKKREIYHKRYLKELEEKYNFTLIDKKKLHEKLIELISINDKNNRPKECYNLKDL